MDVAANELYKKNKYSIHSTKYISVEKSIKEYLKLVKKYKIKSIEDPFAENDWSAWNSFVIASKNVQIVGDDLYVTNLERLKKGFLNNVSKNGKYFINQLDKIKNKYPKVIKEVRGKGLLIGLCLHVNQAKFIQKLLDNNLLTVRAAENVVRLLPPLNVTKSEINLGLKIIEKVCKKF